MAWRTGYPSGRLLLGKAGDGDSLRNDDGDTCRGREGRDELVGAVGIALATSANAWINLAALIFLGLRRYLFQPDETLKSVTLAAATAAVVLANVALLLQSPFAALAGRLGLVGNLIALAGFGLAGLIVYGGAMVLGCKALGVDPERLGLGRLLRRKS